MKILLTLRKAAEAGVPPMKSSELLAACVAPHADTYMYRRALRELVAKTDFVTCDIQSSRTTYEWNPDVRPSLYDLVIRLEGGIHETSSVRASATRACRPKAGPLPERSTPRAQTAACSGKNSA